MSWITIISNPNNGYCGFDRSYSVLEKVKIDSTFNIIEDYIIADYNIKAAYIANKRKIHRSYVARMEEFQQETGYTLRIENRIKIPYI